MPDLSGMADEAKKLAGEHPDAANKGIEEAGQVAGEKPAGGSTARSNRVSRRPRGSWAPTPRAAARISRLETNSEHEDLRSRDAVKAPRFSVDPFAEAHCSGICRRLSAAGQC